MRKFPAAFLLAILCLPVWVFPQFKLGILGSSTAAGTGADADSGWVALVTQHYTALGLLSETVNLAVGGLIMQCLQAMSHRQAGPPQLKIMLLQ